VFTGTGVTTPDPYGSGPAGSDSALGDCEATQISPKPFCNLLPLLMPGEPLIGHQKLVDFVA